MAWRRCVVGDDLASLSELRFSDTALSLQRLPGGRCKRFLLNIDFTHGFHRSTDRLSLEAVFTVKLYEHAMSRIVQPPRQRSRCEPNLAHFAMLECRALFHKRFSGFGAEACRTE